MTLLPLFPLPSVVLFPGALLPLQIFEPRYRAMTADALEGDRRLGMVLLLGRYAVPVAIVWFGYVPAWLFKKREPQEMRAAGGGMMEPAKSWSRVRSPRV